MVLFTCVGERCDGLGCSRIRDANRKEERGLPSGGNVEIEFGDEQAADHQDGDESDHVAEEVERGMDDFAENARNHYEDEDAEYKESSGVGGVPVLCQRDEYDEAENCRYDEEGAGEDGSIEVVDEDNAEDYYCGGDGNFFDGAGCAVGRGRCWHLRYAILHTLRFIYVWS